MSTWKLQDAKQRFSELVRAAAGEPQVVTRHGRDVAVVLDIEEYRRLTGDDLRSWLLSGPKVDDVDGLFERDRTPAREIVLE
ncbi:MAG TPA: type II toxin-antitoxin system Phd/YefM family antitoxin [Marmoricola sp.]